MCYTFAQDYDNAIAKTEPYWHERGSEFPYDAMGEWAREWLVGMTYFSNDEVAEAFIAGAAVGGCEDLSEMVDFGNGLI